MTLHPISGKSYFLLLALLLISGFAPAQTAVPVVLAPVPQLQFFDASGRPLSFGCVFSFQSQTTTPLATYSDFTGQFQNPNPVPLSAGGSANIWLQSGQAYSLVVKSSGGTNCALGQTLYTVDGVGGGASQLNTVVTPSGGSAAFTVQSQNQLFSLTLTGNVAGSPVSFIGVIAPALVTFQITEDGVGAHTFSWPSNVIGAAPIDTTALHVTSQTFIWNGTTIMPVGSGFNSAGNSILPGNAIAGSINNILFVDGVRYAYTAAGINQCLSDARSKSGICDASGVPARTFTAQITVNGGETLVVPSTGVSSWTWSGISDGTSCGIDVEGGGSLIGNGITNGDINDKFALLTSGTVAMRGLLCGNISGSSNYLRIEAGVLALPQTGATFTKGVVDVEGWFDASVLRNVSISLTQDTTANQTGLYASNLCCSATIERVVSDGGFQSGAVPAHITYNSGEVATDSPILIANSFDHPGPGKNAIVFDGTLMGPILDVGQYVEGSNTDTTTPAISVTAPKGSVTFVGGKVNMLAVASTAYCLDAPNTAGNSIATYGLACLSQAGGAQHAINDHVTGYTSTSNAQGMVSDYSTFNFASYTLGHPTIATGIAADGGGFKHKRFGATCTTTASIGNSCTTTFSWTTAFADANYTPACSPVGPANGPVFSIDSFNATGVTVRVYTFVALASGYSGVDCVGVHD